MAACGISLFGVVAAVMDKLVWARAFKFLSILTALIVVATGFILTVTHFTYKVRNSVEVC